MSHYSEKAKKESNSTIAIDFDGVIHKNSKGFHDGTIYDDLLPSTKEALEFLSKKYKLIIYTCKATPERPLVNGKTGVELIWEYLEKHDLAKFIDSITNKKPWALFYIDDKAIRFDSWKQILNEIDGVKYEL